jgi:hypothetical protein
MTVKRTSSEPTGQPSGRVNPAPPSDGLMRVTVQVGARRFDEDLAAQAMITPNIEAVNDALAKNPSRFAEWAMLEALARAEYDEIVSNIAAVDSDTKEVEAMIYLEILDQPSVAGVKAPTVDGIKAMVAVDPRRIELSRRRRDLETVRLAAKGNLEKLAVGRKTLEEKKDSLIAIASNWRSEMATRLQVNMQTFKPGGR